MIDTKDILGMMADDHRNALGLQLRCTGRGTHIRAGDGNTHTLQHQAQRTHGHAADTDQVDPPAGRNIFRNLFASKHKSYSCIVT